MFVSRRVFAVALLLGAAPLAAACDKKPTPAAPPSTGLPPLAPGEAAQAGQPSHDPHGSLTGAAPGVAGADPHAGLGAPTAGLPAGHPSVDKLPAGHPPVDEQATPGDIPFDPKSVIAGELRVDDKVKAKVAAGDVIYLVARAADQPGPPLAVKRLTVAKFPLAFSLDGRDAMMAGTKMQGKISLSARVDKDGDAMTKNPGDVTGQKVVELPADKVVLTLDTVL